MNRFNLIKLVSFLISISFLSACTVEPENIAEVEKIKTIERNFDLQFQIPDLDVSAVGVDFGQASVDGKELSVLALILKNESTQLMPIVVEEIPQIFSLRRNTCGTEIEPKKSCRLEFAIARGTFNGDYQGNLILESGPSSLSIPVEVEVVGNPNQP